MRSLFVFASLVAVGCGQTFIDPETGEELPQLQIMVAEADTVFLDEPYARSPELLGGDVNDLHLRWDVRFSDHEWCVRISELTGFGVPRHCFEIFTSPPPWFVWNEAGPIRDEPYIVTWTVVDSSTVPPREDTAVTRVYVLDERP